MFVLPVVLLKIKKKMYLEFRVRNKISPNLVLLPEVLVAKEMSTLSAYPV